MIKHTHGTWKIFYQRTSWNLKSTRSSSISQAPKILRLLQSAVSILWVHLRSTNMSRTKTQAWCWCWATCTIVVIATWQQMSTNLRCTKSWSLTKWGSCIPRHQCVTWSMITTPAPIIAMDFTAHSSKQPEVTNRLCLGLYRMLMSLLESNLFKQMRAHFWWLITALMFLDPIS